MTNVYTILATNHQGKETRHRLVVTIKIYLNGTVCGVDSTGYLPLTNDGENWSDFRDV
jgi:hypothetical protein